MNRQYRAGGRREPPQVVKHVIPIEICVETLWNALETRVLSEAESTTHLLDKDSNSITVVEHDT